MLHTFPLHPCNTEKQKALAEKLHEGKTAKAWCWWWNRCEIKQPCSQYLSSLTCFSSYGVTGQCLEMYYQYVCSLEKHFLVSVGFKRCFVFWGDSPKKIYVTILCTRAHTLCFPIAWDHQPFLITSDRDGHFLQVLWNQYRREKCYLSPSQRKS